MSREQCYLLFVCVLNLLCATLIVLLGESAGIVFSTALALAAAIKMVKS